MSAKSGRKVAPAAKRGPHRSATVQGVGQAWRCTACGKVGADVESNEDSGGFRSPQNLFLVAGASRPHQISASPSNKSSSSSAVSSQVFPSTSTGTLPCSCGTTCTRGCCLLVDWHITSSSYRNQEAEGHSVGAVHDWALAASGFRIALKA